MAFSLRFVGHPVGMAVFSLALVSAHVFAQPASTQPQINHDPKVLLPDNFSGWVKNGAQTAGTKSAEADAKNADVLSEYGLKNFSEGAYRHGSRELTLRALRFGDATGAYGAFTFYRKPDMRPESIGNGGATNGTDVVFWSGNTLIEATFDRPAANDESALTALAKTFPSAGGSSDVAPSLPEYLPANFLDRSAVRYAIGPTSYIRGGGVLPPNLIDFSRDAEVVTARYSERNQHETLTLIEYPTPQIAIQGEKALEALQSSSTDELVARRTGPIVAVASGAFSKTDANALIAQVKYQADVTWNRADMGSRGEVKNAAHMLLGIAYLTAMLAACALLLGFFLGGGRALWRVMHGKPASIVYEEDFISLGLSSWQPGSSHNVH
ncbi:MAG TPA: DUF6599 family protein [Silvibacterium sp.]|nr:DUF6599 family protein [Silvibacterium sp.]